jgi:hypothetical protein
MVFPKHFPDHRTLHGSLSHPLLAVGEEEEIDSPVNNPCPYPRVWRCNVPMQDSLSVMENPSSVDP